MAGQVTNMFDVLLYSFGGKEYLHFRKETHGRFSGPLQDHY